MTCEEDWHLPEDYWVECRVKGGFTLHWDDLEIREFPAGTPKNTIEAWCDAYATGRRAGEAWGETRGRSALAGEFRRLLQL
jgi:hypothetical protein